MTDKIQYKLLNNDPDANNISDSESDMEHSESELNLALEDIIINEVVVTTESQAAKLVNMRKKPVAQKFYEYLTTVTHFVIVLFVIFILYLSFSHEVELFTWHPILLSISWMFLMIEAILALSSDNSLIRYIPPRSRVSFHWIVQATATTCTISGFLVVYINKNLKDKEHFKSWHGIFGLISIICLIPTCIFGALTLYKIDLRKYIKPTIIKISHITSGVLTFTIGTVTVLLGLFSNWFMKRTNMTAQVICCIAVLISTLWILFRPLKTLYQKLK